MTGQQEIFAFRLKPGQDLKLSLLDFAAQKKLKAAYIITCVGSLQTAHLRMAGAKIKKKWEEKLEIVSLTGTLFEGECHLHISLSTELGNVFGGHMLDGCLINSTAEIVVDEAKHLFFSREKDADTGYTELVVTNRQ